MKKNRLQQFAEHVNIVWNMYITGFISYARLLTRLRSLEGIYDGRVTVMAMGDCAFDLQVQIHEVPRDHVDNLAELEKNYEN